MDFSNFKNTPFLSKKTIKDHLNLLKGYTKNTEELLKKIKKLKQDKANPNYSDFRTHMEACRHNYNASALHRMYFSQINSETMKIPEEFKRFIEDINKKAYNWNDYNEWKNDFIGVAKASRGWALMGYSVFENILCNIAVDNHDHGLPPGFIPFVVLDVWEHAYIGDFGTNREKYINQWFKYVDWNQIMALIARWLPVVRGDDLVMKLTAALQQKIVTLGLIRE